MASLTCSASVSEVIPSMVSSTLSSMARAGCPARPAIGGGAERWYIFSANIVTTRITTTTMMSVMKLAPRSRIGLLQFFEHEVGVGENADVGGNLHRLLGNLARRELGVV